MAGSGPGGSFTFAEAEYNSVYGTVRSGWQKVGDAYRFDITVPANCTARVTLPDGTCEAVAAGRHQ